MKLNKEQVKKIYAMYYAGYTVGEIAKALDILEVDVIKVLGIKY